MSGGDHISKHLPSGGKFNLAPRFTVVHHPIRVKYELSFIDYAVLDSIDQLSHRPDHPWCTMSKEKLAGFLDIGRASVFRAIKDGLEKGLIEKNERGDYRSTSLWVEDVRLYDNEKG